MLHETAVAWMRERLKKTLPTRSWAETFDDCGARLKACATYTNEEHDVAGLCLGLPTTIGNLDRRRGDRLLQMIPNGKRNQLQVPPSHTAPPDHHYATVHIK